MAATEKKAGPEAKVAPAEKTDLEVVAEKLQARYNELQKAFANEASIANRYDLKVRMEELSYAFDLIFHK